MENTMKVEIWSDVMCPFCYIGKRKFEAALEQFPDKDKVVGLEEFSACTRTGYTTG